MMSGARNTAWALGAKESYTASADENLLSRL